MFEVKPKESIQNSSQDQNLSLKIKRQQEIEAIKEGVRIIDLLNREGIYYRRVGNNRLRLYSLVNDEKEPSLVVDLVKNRFFDNSSGRKGSVIDFYMYMYDVDYVTAIRDLKKILLGLDVKVEKRPVKLNQFNRVKVEFLSLMHNYIMPLKNKTVFLDALERVIQNYKSEITNELNKQMSKELDVELE